MFHITKRVIIEQAASIGQNQSQFSLSLLLVHHILYSKLLGDGLYPYFKPWITLPSMTRITCTTCDSRRKELCQLQQLELEWKVHLDVDAGSWNVRCGDKVYPDACSLSEPRSVLLASRMEQMSAYTGTKSTATHKRIPHHTKDALQSENLSTLNCDH